MKTMILILLVCFSHSAIAETYKCIKSGRTIYSSFPCGDNAQVVENHVMTIEKSPSANNQERNSAQAPVAPIVETVKPSVAPAQAICTNEEAAFEAVKKSMRAGYPASQATYWHKQFIDTRDAFDICRERQQKSANK